MEYFLIALVILVLFGPLAYHCFRAMGFLRTDEEEVIDAEDSDKRRLRGELDSMDGSKTGKRLGCALLMFLVLAGLGVFAALYLIDWYLDHVGYFLLTFGAVILGAFIFIEYGNRKRFRSSAEKAREIRPLRDFLAQHPEVHWAPYEGLSRGRGRAILALSALIQGAMVLAAVFVFVVAFSQGFRANKAYYVLFAIVLSAAVYVCVKFARRARNHYWPQELSRMLDSHLTPVVYLRPFSSDTESFPNPTNVLNNPARWIDWDVEGVLAKTLRSYAPFVAIGRPEDRVDGVPIRPFRLYAGENWQSAVTGLCEIAKLCIVRAQVSPGVRWEIAHALSRERRCTTAVLLVGSDGKPMTKQSYCEFASTMQGITDIKWPIAGWGCWYFWIDQMDEVHLIDAEKVEEDGLERATETLLQQRAEKSGESWESYSVLDQYLPMEYRVLVLGPPVLIVVLILLALSSAL